MKRQELQLFLGLQIAAIVWGLLVFNLSESRFLAGLLAGGFFIVSAIFMLNKARRWPNWQHSLCFYALWINLFGIMVPMVAFRIAQSGLGFENVRIFGLSGPQFHGLSGIGFSILILATIVDWLRTVNSTF